MHSSALLTYTEGPIFGNFAIDFLRVLLDTLIIEREKKRNKNHYHPRPRYIVPIGETSKREGSFLLQVMATMMHD